ncbi:ABC transporter substrate-binding protein [Haloarchaeobius sp. HRN-SO-5]|uniref:ABC transporter substrate-binding protein n=1 Tax=Haloarchaeobius sp. HRN-SO-5 TaxID=3446118 RepID=UPI003EBC189B
MPQGEGGQRRSGMGRRTAIKSGGVAALVGLTGCIGGGGDNTTSGGGGGTNGDSGAIKVGNLSPFSGGLGWIGPNSRRGVETALEGDGGVNTDGVLGRTIEITEQDTETKPQAAISGFNTLDSQGVVTMVGPSSTVMPSLVDPAKSSNLSIVSPMTGTIQLDDVGGEYIWRTVPSDSIGARAQAKFTYEELGFRKMALAYKNDKGSQSFSKASGEHFEFLGGEVVTEVALDPGASSYRSAVQKLQSSDADVVSMTAGTEVTSLFIKNYVEAGANEDFQLTLGNDVLTPDFIEEMGADVMEGMVGQAPAPGPAFDQFREKHTAMHGKEPGTFAASAYDAMNLIGLAFVAEGEASRAAIPNQLGNIGTAPGKKVETFAEGKAALNDGKDIDYVGAANPQNYDDTGDPLGPFSALRAKNGEWEEVLTYSSDELAQE